MEKDGGGWRQGGGWRDGGGHGGGIEAKGKEMKDGEERQFNPNSHQGTEQTSGAEKQR